MAATGPATEVLHSNDSKSLWNYTLSPGWTEREVEVFRIALMKFGIGRWTKIVESRCLPGKTVAQLNNQCQRLIGQQSTSEFTGLNVDPSKVFAANSLKAGTRKNGCLINMENNPTRAEIERKRKRNQELYELSQEEIDKLEIPVLKQSDMSAVVIKSTFHLKDKANRRRERYDKLRALQQQLERLKSALADVESGKVVPAPKPVEKAASGGAGKKAAAKSKGKAPAKAQAKTKAKPTKSKAKAKAKAPASSKSRALKRAKTQEEEDAELARRLQMEEEGAAQLMDIDSMSESDEDFVRRRPKRRRAPRRRT